jgi:glucose-1-phosphate cytidylyltransferase
MKVVLFCGGLGLRMRDFADNIPKPMVMIGYRPVLWHLMKYYAHFGHKDFILCLGYRGDCIKEYFLKYDECLSNDFVLSEGGKKMELLNSDIQDWRISFVDTGFNSNIGERLAAVRPFLEGEEAFLANYADGLTDLNLQTMLAYSLKHGKVATVAAVTPRNVFHILELDKAGRVKDIRYANEGALVINGGYFVFRKEIFDYIQPGDELVEEPFRRLIKADQLIAYKHNGFWACMDTFKDKQQLEEMYLKGNAPWKIWMNGPSRERCEIRRRVSE